MDHHGAHSPTSGAAWRPEPTAQRGSGSTALLTIIAVLLAALLAVQVVDTLGAGPAPTWEYSVVGVPDLEFEAMTAALGSAGWELVFARRASNEAGDMLYECIFKRRT